MPQPPPPQNPDPVESPEPSGRTGGTPLQGVPQTGRATPPAGNSGAWGPPNPGPFAARPPIPGQVPPGPPLGSYGAAPGQGTYGPTRAYGPGYGPPAQPYGPPHGAAPTQAMGSTSATGATTVTATDATAKKKGGDLNINKLAAGAGAAATSAVLGSFFGDLGTVTGAAVGSVFSAIVTAAYQHSLDKTRDTVKAKIKLPGGRTVDVEGKTEVPAPPVAPGGETGQARVFVTPGDRPTEVMSAVPATGAVAVGPPRSRRRILLLTGFAVVVFALGMLAVTGLELVKGSPLSNTSSSTSTRGGGTSLGTVLGGGSGGASTETSDTETTSATSTEEPSDEETTSAPSTAEDEDTESTAERRSGADADESEPTTTSRSTRVTPTPTPTPDADSGSGGGADANAQSGGGADTPEQQ